jgi:hypothetical protein
MVMKKGQYVRIYVYSIPRGVWAADLPGLAELSVASSLWEGWLTAPVVLRRRIHLLARFRHHHVCLGKYRSAQVRRISGAYVVTADSLVYQLLRVPPLLRGETLDHFG